MSNSDFPLESDPVPAVPAPRPEPPRLVNLPSTFDMSEFLSEAPTEAPLDLGAFLAETPAEPVIEASSDPGILTPAAATQEPPTIAGPHPGAAPSSASVLEFPGALSGPESPAAAEAPAAGRMVPLVEILEQQGGMNWRDSVALVHKLCRQLRDQGAHGRIILDPRNIQIAATGEVHLLPSQPGGDPLVMQVGRLLRTMLMGRPAPSELRLLLSQATFELPIFESLDDVDRALTEVERIDDRRDAPADRQAPVSAPGALQKIGSAPLRRDASARSTVGSRAIRPGVAPRRNAFPQLSPVVAFLSMYGTRVAAGTIVAAALVAILLSGPAFLFPPVTNEPATARIAPGTLRPEPSAATVPRERDERAGALPPPAEGAAPPSERRPVFSANQSSGGRPLQLPSVDSRAGSVLPAAPPAVSTVGVVAPRESEKRAAALIAQGQAAEAARVFDSLLMADPLYEPKASDLTPESLAAFRSSQRVLLPQLARRGYERARAALAAGETDRALSTARDTAAIMDRTSVDPALRPLVQRLIEDASIALAAADEIIYTAKDSGVVPPRALSRQFPAATPSGVPPHRVGTLEMVIAKDGTVEFVKLHTPLNRYHERMIVSAAKAWQYRPATRNGRPVKYRVTVTINLPENGTY
jgi:hypothetical protein